jgi:hypothetical protein
MALRGGWFRAAMSDCVYDAVKAGGRRHHPSDWPEPSKIDGDYAERPSHRFDAGQGKRGASELYSA